MSTLASRVAQFEADTAIARAIVHGPASGDGSLVQTESGPVRSFARVAAELDEEINGRADGILAGSLDAAEGAEIAAVASLTHAVEAAGKQLDAHQAAEVAGQFAQQAEGFALQAAEVAASGNALYVDSVAALRALPAPQKKCVVTLGSYIGGGVFAGEGGGQLLWVPASTRPDNGITVFMPSSAPANGRWERGGVAVPEWGGAVGDGITDDKVPMARWLGLGGALALTGGKTYRVTAQSSGVAGTNIDGRGAMVLVDMPQSSEVGALSWAGPGDLGSATTATAALTKGLYAVPVANASAYQPGDTIWILSTEYFNGISGFGGYRPKTKGEISVVRSVSGNTITLNEALKDDYALDGNTITVSRRGVIRGISVKGVRFRGRYGWAGTHNTSDNPTGARAIQLADVEGVDVSGCEFSNFPRFGAEFSYCRDIAVLGNTFTGFDIGEATNQPAGSVWFTGAHFNSCENVAFVGNHARNSRRHFDTDTGTGKPVSRGHTIANNTATNCMNVVGTHACEDVVIKGNTSVQCRGGINFRGKNAVISGNIVRLDRTVTDGIGISCGHTASISSAYTEYTSVGSIVISGNHISGPHNQGIRITADVDSLEISDNTITDSSDSSIAVVGKRTRDVCITGNSLTRNLAGSPKIGIHFPNYSTIPREVLDGVIVSNNRVRGADASGLVIGGALISAPADNIVVSGNVFSGHTERHISLSAPTTGEVVGYYGEAISIYGNVFSGPTPSNGDVHLGGAARVHPRIGENVFSANSAGLVLTASSVTSGSPRTWKQGMRVRYPTPSGGGYADRICVSSGTAGTLTGVTGSIAAGSNQLTVNEVAGIPPGTYLTVAGAGLAAGTRVLSVAGNVATLSTNATNTVADAAVSYTASSFKDYGAIAA